MKHVRHVLDTKTGLPICGAPPAPMLVQATVRPLLGGLRPAPLCETCLGIAQGALEAALRREQR